MPELLGGLCLFALGVFIFALIGHALWVVGAAVVSGIFGPGPAPSTSPPAVPRQPAEKPSLEAVINQLHLLREQGTIDAAAHERLLTAVRAEQEALQERIGPSTEAARAASPGPSAAPSAATKPDGLPILPAASSGAPPVRVVVEAEVAEVPPAVLMATPTTDSAQTRELATPAERMREYAARRALAEEREAAVATPQPAKPPSRPFSQLLAAFMEERNIRWGELVGGLLIVG